MEDTRKLYFASYDCCTSSISHKPERFSFYKSETSDYFADRSIRGPFGNRFRNFNGKESDSFIQKKWEISTIYPMVNKTGSHYTPDDNWAYWLGKMNTYTFEDISFSCLNAKGEMEEVTQIFPTSRPGRFIVNAFSLTQARNILLANIKHHGVLNPDGGENPTVRDIKFKIGPSHLGYKRGEGSDCDPETWGWDWYFEMVLKKLAFERGLIPRGQEEFFAKYRNAAEEFSAQGLL